MARWRLCANEVSIARLCRGCVLRRARGNPTVLSTILCRAAGPLCRSPVVHFSLQLRCRLAPRAANPSRMRKHGAHSGMQRSRPHGQSTRDTGRIQSQAEGGTARRGEGRRRSRRARHKQRAERQGGMAEDGSGAQGAKGRRGTTQSIWCTVLNYRRTLLARAASVPAPLELEHSTFNIAFSAMCQFSLRTSVPTFRRTAHELQAMPRSSDLGPNRFNGADLVGDRFWVEQEMSERQAQCFVPSCLRLILGPWNSRPWRAWRALCLVLRVGDWCASQCIVHKDTPNLSHLRSPDPQSRSAGCAMQCLFVLCCVPCDCAVCPLATIQLFAGRLSIDLIHCLPHNRLRSIHHHHQEEGSDRPWSSEYQEERLELPRMDR